MNDQAYSWQVGFQDAASFLHEEIVFLHNHIMQYSALILGFVGVLLGAAMYRANGGISHRYYVHGTTLETVWTIAPVFILIAIAIPSFKLLYLQDEIIDSSLTLKAIGRQWYWSYEYSDFQKDNESLTFDSYMKAESDLVLGESRLLEVDNDVKLPIDTNIRIITTSGDVIHSFALPSGGVKVDAVPGRLNAVNAQFDRPAVITGQCSEICGFSHGFMPIVVTTVTTAEFSNWLLSALEQQ